MLESHKFLAAMAEVEAKKNADDDDDDAENKVEASVRGRYSLTAASGTQCRNATLCSFYAVTPLFLIEFMELVIACCKMIVLTHTCITKVSISRCFRKWFSSPAFSHRVEQCAYFNHGNVN